MLNQCPCIIGAAVLAAAHDAGLTNGWELREFGREQRRRADHKQVLSLNVHGRSESELFLDLRRQRRGRVHSVGPCRARTFEPAVAPPRAPDGSAMDQLEQFTALEVELLSLVAQVSEMRGRPPVVEALQECAARAVHLRTPLLSQVAGMCFKTDEQANNASVK